MLIVTTIAEQDESGKCSMHRPEARAFSLRVLSVACYLHANASCRFQAGIRTKGPLINYFATAFRARFRRDNEQDV